MTLHSWVPDRRQDAGVRCRLFCFPHAAGNAMFFRPWQLLTPDWLDLCPVELPGHGARMSEQPFHHMSTLMEDLCEALQPLLTVPFAFFGHSVGACIAHAAARGLRSNDGRGPGHLFVSGRSAPDHTIREAKSPTDADLLSLLGRFGGTPAAVMARPELMTAFLPTLRADLALAQDYTAGIAEQIACPITAFGGSDDTVDLRSLEAWGKFTSGAFRLCVFPGGHFYLSTVADLLLEQISHDLQASEAVMSQSAALGT